jgi:hypothetical protein
MNGVPKAVPGGLLRGAGIEVLPIKPVTGAGVCMKLPPKLADFETLSDSIPELAEIFPWVEPVLVRLRVRRHSCE